MAKEPKTSRAIDAVVAAAQKNRLEERFGDWDLTLYFPPLTTQALIAAEERLEAKYKPEARNSAAYRHEKNVILVIMQAQLEDGTPAFSMGDKITLMNKASYTEMMRMVNAVYSAGMPNAPKDVEEGKGGSGKMENSASE